MLCTSTCDAGRHQVLLIGVIKVIVVAFVRLTTDRLVSFTRCVPVDAIWGPDPAHARSDFVHD